MKTNLNRQITTPLEADSFIRNLHTNDEIWHFDDDPKDCLPNITDEQADKLNRLVNDMFNLKNYDPFNLAVQLWKVDQIEEELNVKYIKKLDKVLVDIMDQLIDKGFDHDDIASFLLERALKNV